MTPEEMRRELVRKQARVVELADELAEARRRLEALTQQISMARRLMCFAILHARGGQRERLAAAFETLCGGELE